MERGNYNSLIFENNQFVGICLGSDFCSEHEHGINKILENFGINRPDFSLKSKFLNLMGLSKPKYGIEKRKTTLCPKNLFWIDCQQIVRNNNQSWFGIYFDDYSDTFPTIIPCYVKKDEKLITLWDGEGFCILSCDENNRAYLQELYSAFEQNNIVFILKRITLSAGLTILISDKISEDIKKDWYDFDLEQEKLQKAFNDSGIEKKLRKAGKKFFALTPKKFDENGQLMIWLNPFEQKRYNSGYVSLKDLEDWIENKGKIVK